MLRSEPWTISRVLVSHDKGWRKEHHKEHETDQDATIFFVLCFFNLLYILINVAGSSNITKETKLVTVTYTFSGTDATFTVNVSEMFDQNMTNVKYSVVGKKITLK